MEEGVVSEEQVKRISGNVQAALQARLLPRASSTPACIRLCAVFCYYWLPNTQHVYRNAHAALQELRKGVLVCSPQACGCHEVASGTTQAEFENSRDYKPEAKDWLSSYWAGFNSPNQIARIRNTGVPMNFLKEVRGCLSWKTYFAQDLSTTPQHRTILPDPARAPESAVCLCAP